MIIIYIVAIIKRIWGDIGVGAKDIGKYQNTMSKIDEIPILHLWSVMPTLSYLYLAYLFISSVYAPETTSAIILWGNVTRLWICLLLERGNILFPKGPFGLIVGQVTALQLSFLISKKKQKQWCNRIDLKVVQFSGTLYEHVHPISFEAGIRCFTVFFYWEDWWFYFLCLFLVFPTFFCPILTCVNFSFFVLTTLSSGTTLYVNSVARWISLVKHD